MGRDQCVQIVSVSLKNKIFWIYWNICKMIKKKQDCTVFVVCSSNFKLLSKQTPRFFAWCAPTREPAAGRICFALFRGANYNSLYFARVKLQKILWQPFSDITQAVMQRTEAARISGFNGQVDLHVISVTMNWNTVSAVNISRGSTQSTK